MLSGRQTVWRFQIISTTCDQFSRTDSSQNKGTQSPPLHIDLAIFSLSSQSGLLSAFRRLLLTGSLTAHIRLNKSFCQFLVSHFESWRYTQCKSSYESAKMILRRIVRLDLCWNLAWFAYSVVITKITVTVNTFFRAVKSDVPASPSAYSLPWAGGSRGSTGCVCAPHRCSLLCLPGTHNTESTLTFNSTNIHSSNKLKQTQHLATCWKQALKNVLLIFFPSNQKGDT